MKVKKVQSLPSPALLERLPLPPLTIQVTAMTLKLKQKSNPRKTNQSLNKLRKDQKTPSPSNPPLPRNRLKTPRKPPAKWCNESLPSRASTRRAFLKHLRRLPQNPLARQILKILQNPLRWAKEALDDQNLLSGKGPCLRADGSGKNWLAAPRNPQPILRQLLQVCLFFFFVFFVCLFFYQFFDSFFRFVFCLLYLS